VKIPEQIYELLKANVGKIVSRAEILKAVWGEDPSKYFTNTIDVNICYLRKKIGADKIKSIRGKGYILLEVA
jgi:DNA-binding response OmpR family regulator